MAYNAKEHTSSITPPGQSPIALTYDGAGQSRLVSIGTTSFTTGLQGIDSMTTPVGTTYFTRDPSGNLISERTPSGTYYYLFNNIGSVTGLVDSSGNLAATYHYAPYGALTSSSGPAATSVQAVFGFAGGLWLPSVGLYKFGVRYYNPATGRWLQQDPLAGTMLLPTTMNRYVYAGDNPVNFVDVSGTAFGFLAQVITTAVSGVSAGIVGTIAGGLSGNSLIGIAAGGCAYGAVDTYLAGLQTGSFPIDAGTGALSGCLVVGR